MRVKKVNYSNQEAILIYIDSQEHQDDAIQKEICDYKKKYKDVAVFISGKNNIEKALTKIVQEKM